jgi:hypothetical protein
MEKKRVYKAEEEGYRPIIPVITVMQPTVVNVDGPSENVASEGVSRDPEDEENIESFGDFDNREDGK